MFYSSRYTQLMDCNGSSVGLSQLETIPDNIRKSLPKQDCCHSWEVDWNGRVINDVVCVAEPSECSIQIKLLKSTFYQKCFKDALKTVSETIAAKGLALKGN